MFVYEKHERALAGALRFRRADGRAIRVAQGGARGDHLEIRRRNRRAGLSIDAETPVALEHGGRYSLDMAVEGLLAAEGLLGLGEERAEAAAKPP